MKKTQFIWHNGTLTPWDEAKVHILTHALHYGSGVFEGIRVYKTSDGPAIFELKKHVERLIFSAQTLHMQIPYSVDEIINAIKTTVAVNKLDEGYIRPLAFYGYGELGLRVHGNPIELAIACWPWGSYHKEESLDVKVSQYIRIHPKSTVVEAKICGHYVNSILSSIEIHNTKYHEVLLLDDDGFVCEGSSVNVFMVKDGVIYTPKLGTILPGITRSIVIKIAQSLGYSVHETEISLEKFYTADEGFFTGTAAEISFIRSIDDKLIGKDNQQFNISKQLKSAYMDIVRGKNKEFINCLTYIN